MYGRRHCPTEMGKKNKNNYQDEFGMAREILLLGSLMVLIGSAQQLDWPFAKVERKINFYLFSRNTFGDDKNGPTLGT